MGRRIDTDDLMEEIAKIQDLRTLSTKTIGEAIDRTPTIEPERARGKWMQVPCGMNIDIQCTNCNTIYFQHDYYSLCEIMNGLRHGLETCPKCGADMRGEQNE